jgi:hypothetical protein
MNRNAHLAVGFITVAIAVLVSHWLCGWFNIDIQTLISLIVITYIFSLLPDIDHKSGTCTWLFLGTGIVGIIISLLNNQYHFTSLDNLMWPSIILLGLTFLTANFMGHRKFIHSITFDLIISSLLYFVVRDWTLCLIAFISFYSHLAADKLWLKFK